MILFQDYITGRLKRRTGTRALGQWLEQEVFTHLTKVPRYLIPRYFDAVISPTYLALLKQTW